MKTPYQRNGKKPIKADYKKEFGLYGEMLWKVDSALYEVEANARKTAKANQKASAKVLKGLDNKR